MIEKLNVSGSNYAQEDDPVRVERQLRNVFGDDFAAEVTDWVPESLENEPETEHGSFAALADTNKGGSPRWFPFTLPGSSSIVSPSSARGLAGGTETNGASGASSITNPRRRRDGWSDRVDIYG
jgi:hypothetical protein